MATVLVLGGGIAGAAAANALRERLGERHRVVVVERDAEQVFAPSLLWLMVGKRRPAAISRPSRGLERQIAAAGLRLGSALLRLPARL